MTDRIGGNMKRIAYITVRVELTGTNEKAIRNRIVKHFKRHDQQVGEIRLVKPSRRARKGIMEET